MLCSPGSQGNESTLRTSGAAAHSAEPLHHPAPLCPVQRCRTTPCRCLPAGSSNTAFASWVWRLLEGFWLCRSLVWSAKAVKRSRCARCPSWDHPRARECIVRAESGTSVLSVSKTSSPGRKAEWFCAGAHCAKQGGGAGSTTSFFLGADAQTISGACFCLPQLHFLFSSQESSQPKKKHFLAAVEVQRSPAGLLGMAQRWGAGGREVWCRRRRVQGAAHNCVFREMRLTAPNGRGWPISS